MKQHTSAIAVAVLALTGWAINQVFSTVTAPTTGPVAISGSLAAEKGAGEAANLHVGAAAPNFTIETLDGRSISLASLKGKPLVIDFWATWCGPCRETLKEMDELSRQYKKLTVLAITGEEKETVENFVNDGHYGFRSCLDASGDMSRAYKVRTIPKLVFIDPKGSIAALFVGMPDAAHLTRALRRIGL